MVISTLHIVTKAYWGERSEPCTGEVNANCVYMFVYMSSTGWSIAHAQYSCTFGKVDLHL